MIDTLKAQMRREHISTRCKALFKCNETSGQSIVDSVGGIVYDQANADTESSGYITYGAPRMRYEMPNAIRIENLDDIANPGVNATTYTAVDWNLALDADKILVLAAHVIVERDNATRIHMGGGGQGSGSFSISLSTGMHQAFSLPNETYGIGTNPDDGLARNLLASADPKTLVTIWDGINKQLISRVITTTGVLDVDAVSAADMEITGVISTGPDYANGQQWIPSAVARWTGANYYGVMLQELDELPSELNYKLALWGEMLRAGFKGAPDL